MQTLHLIEFGVANQISVKRFVSTIFIAFAAAHKSLADDAFVLCACESITHVLATRVRGQLTMKFQKKLNRVQVF